MAIVVGDAQPSRPVFMTDIRTWRDNPSKQADCAIYGTARDEWTRQGSFVRARGCLKNVLLGWLEDGRCSLHDSTSESIHHFLSTRLGTDEHGQWQYDYASTDCTRTTTPTEQLVTAPPLVTAAVWWVPTICSTVATPWRRRRRRHRESCHSPWQIELSLTDDIHPRITTPPQPSSSGQECSVFGDWTMAFITRTIAKHISAYSLGATLFNNGAMST